MKKIMLDFNGMDSREEIQEYLAEKMDFPYYYGRNLDALYDCLTDICEPTAVACRLFKNQEDSPLAGYLNKVCRTFQDAEADNGYLAVFFGDWNS